MIFVFLEASSSKYLFGGEKKKKNKVTDAEWIFHSLVQIKYTIYRCAAALIKLNERQWRKVYNTFSNKWWISVTNEILWNDRWMDEENKGKILNVVVTAGRSRDI